MAKSYESDANDNNMVKAGSAANSDSSSANTSPSTTRLGRKPVPVTSTCEELLHAVEEFSGDSPFTAELLRKSSVKFTDNQSVMVQDVLNGAEVETKYGFERQYLDALAVLEESLFLRIEEEKIFFSQQKKQCTEIYEILRQSSFPYSAKQSSCFFRMVTALYDLTGHPESETDKEFISEMRKLVGLLQSGDHLKDQTPYRVIVTSTIHYYLRQMLIKLDRLAKEEEERLHPDFIHPHSEINFATYLVVFLGPLVDNSEVLTPREHFHFGMVEIYTKFIDIFKNSGLDLTYVQEKVIQKIERRVRDLKRKPLMGKYQGIVEACLEFISELEECSPDREVTLLDGEVVLAYHGANNAKVREIGWKLVYLRPVAREHLTNFPSFGNGVVDVIETVTERFLALYPFQ